MIGNSVVENATVRAGQASYATEPPSEGASGGRRELFSCRFAAVASILAGGVALYFGIAAIAVLGVAAAALTARRVR
ncbi:hypothetical protein [Kitasatospora sp. NPDC056531]|uniref:hypothetical protein n=1 Tax=Kitasatospora sp. NPDC056531 TaxID=3345856 RepID=UPI0036B33A0E